MLVHHAAGAVVQGEARPSTPNLRSVARLLLTSGLDGPRQSVLSFVVHALQAWLRAHAASLTARITLSGPGLRVRFDYSGSAGMIDLSGARRALARVHPDLLSAWLARAAQAGWMALPLFTPHEALAYHADRHLCGTDDDEEFAEEARAPGETPQAFLRRARRQGLRTHADVQRRVPGYSGVRGPDMPAGPLPVAAQLLEDRLARLETQARALDQAAGPCLYDGDALWPSWEEPVLVDPFASPSRLSFTREMYLETRRLPDEARPAFETLICTADDLRRVSAYLAGAAELQAGLLSWLRDVQAYRARA